MIFYFKKLNIIILESITLFAFFPEQFQYKLQKELLQIKHYYL